MIFRADFTTEGLTYEVPALSGEGRAFAGASGAVFHLISPVALSYATNPAWGACEATISRLR